MKNILYLTLLMALSSGCHSAYDIDEYIKNTVAEKETIQPEDVKVIQLEGLIDRRIAVTKNGVKYINVNRADPITTEKIQTIDLRLKKNAFKVGSDKNPIGINPIGMLGSTMIDAGVVYMGKDVFAKLKDTSARQEKQKKVEKKPTLEFIEPETGGNIDFKTITLRPDDSVNIVVGDTVTVINPRNINVSRIESKWDNFDKDSKSVGNFLESK